MKNMCPWKLSTTLMLVFLFLVTLLPGLTLVQGETAVHDLEVSLTAEEKKIYFRDDGKGHLSSGNSTVLNCTIVNRGDFNESNVVLQLLINGTMVLYATTPSLEINCTFWSAYFWSPEDADYNLTVYALPVSDEDNIANNNVTKWVRVCPDQRPIANFAYSPPPPPPGPIKDENVTFNASASDDPDWGNITIYSWNFNGTVRNETVPVVTYKFLKHGNATVTLTLYDTENLPNSTSTNITVYVRPIANFTIDTPSPYFVNETLTFNATDSHDPDGNITKYFWDWGDGTYNTTTVQVINHTYRAPETYRVYRVNLTVTDNDNLINYTTRDLPVSGVYMKVEPTPAITNPTETFTVNITIYNVKDLYSYQFNLRWPPSLLDIGVPEYGEIFGPWDPTKMDFEMVNFQPLMGFVTINGTLLGAVPGVNSTKGTLAIISFTVRDAVTKKGNTGKGTLDLNETILLNSTQRRIEHAVEDGDCYTMKPVANFTWKPEAPPINVLIEFDASASYDPWSNITCGPGEIKNYLWDWKDTTTNSTPNCRINHTYTVAGIYWVNLTVTDDEGDIWSFKGAVTVGYVHDVAIIDVRPWYNETAGVLHINVTVLNNGTAPTESGTVFLYYDGNDIGSQLYENLRAGQNTTLPPFEWSIYDYSYSEKKYVQIVPKGNYTISAYAPLESDSNPDNNRVEDSVVTVYLAGDITRDNKTSMDDVNEVVTDFGSYPGDSKWNEDADLNSNGRIDIGDIGIACDNFGQTDP